MFFDEGDKVDGRVASQCRLAEVRVGGQKIGGRRVKVREVAAPAAGNGDLFADAVGVLDEQYAPPAPPPIMITSKFDVIAAKKITVIPVRDQ